MWYCRFDIVKHELKAKTMGLVGGGDQAVDVHLIELLGCVANRLLMHALFCDC